MKGCLARATAVVACAIGSFACGDSGLTFEYRSGPYTFSRSDRTAIETLAARAVRDVREVLPDLPSELKIIVAADTRVIPETGENGSSGRPNLIYWVVDPSDKDGVTAIVQAQLRATLFHEIYHLVRGNVFRRQSLVDHAIAEGLATAFEGDSGAAETPWGAYSDEVVSWTREFLALPDDAPREQWMFRHPDGRRWIGYKVGTYLADRAVEASGLSLSELATVPSAQILEWAWP